MASGRITLSYTITSNDATSATVRVTMTYYGNGETWKSSPSSNNCYITLNGTTKYFTHAYTTSTSAQTMGYADFTITKTHSTQSLTATGGITNYSTYYSNPTGSCAVSVSAKTSYAISYKANGHGSAPAAQTKWHGEGLVLRPAMSATGWTFIGWNIYATSTSARYNAEGWYTDEDDATLYGIWEKDITLSYDVGNGSGAPASQTNTIYNTTTSYQFTIPSTRPTRTNYDFLGWSLSDAATTASFQPNDSITLSDSDTLYAVWKLAYIASTISDISAVRCDSDGTSNDEGTHGKLTFKVSKYSNGSEQVYPTVSAKYDTNTKITFEDPTEENNIQTYTSNTFELNGDNQHDIVITKQDGDYGTKTFSTYISAKFFTIDITADGKGIGLLTTAPDNGIVVGGNLTLHKSSGDSPSLIFQRGNLTDNSNDWRIYDKKGWLYFGQRGLGSTDWPDNQEWSISTGGKFSGYIDWANVTDKPDYITDQGTVTESTNGTGLWRYRKWNSGFQEVWYRGSVNFTGATSNSANGWYRRIKTFAIPYDSMTNITAFDDNAVPVVTGAYSGTLLSTGGLKDNGTTVELQDISGAEGSVTSIPGWSIYIAGMPR